MTKPQLYRIPAFVLLSDCFLSGEDYFQPIPEDIDFLPLNKSHVLDIAIPSTSQTHTEVVPESVPEAVSEAIPEAVSQSEQDPPNSPDPVLDTSFATSPSSSFTVKTTSRKCVITPVTSPLPATTHAATQFSPTTELSPSNFLI